MGKIWLRRDSARNIQHSSFPSPSYGSDFGIYLSYKWFAAQYITVSCLLKKKHAFLCVGLGHLKHSKWCSCYLCFLKAYTGKLQKAEALSWSLLFLVQSLLILAPKLNSPLSLQNSCLWLSPGKWMNWVGDAIVLMQRYLQSSQVLPTTYAFSWLPF